MNYYENIIMCTLYTGVPLCCVQIDGMNGTLIANQFVSTSFVRQNRTMITFDNGARWQAIDAPTLDVDNNPINCNMVSVIHLVDSHMCKYKYIYMSVPQ